MSFPNFVLHQAKWQGQLHDLYIKNGKIEELKPSNSKTELPSTQIYDAQGLLLFPGLTDAHMHVREPGHEYKEDISTALAAAASGGFSQVMAMANTNPVNDNASVTKLITSRAKDSHPQGPFLYPIGALSQGLQGLELAPMIEMARAGCIAFSNDGLPVADNELFRHALEYSFNLGLKVIDHCEDPSLSAKGLINEGIISSSLGLKGQPSVAESLQVARDILLSAYLDIPIHLAHISCRESVELIAWAKSKGIQVSSETCPHYLLWDESLVADYNTLAKVNPPLRTQDDITTLRQAVREQIIDILVTDHAPHADFEKEIPFAEALNGISGLDTALSLSWSLVRENILSMEDLLRCWCYDPGKIFNLSQNRFLPGDPANFILFDPNETWQVTTQTMVSKGKNTPCLEQKLTGKVKAHFIHGKLIYKALENS